MPCATRVICALFCRCTKAVGHDGRHRGPHGNLNNSILVASRDEFDLKDRKCAPVLLNGEQHLPPLCAFKRIA